MAWVEEVERAIVDEYVVMAQCFPASDWGLESYRALWLDSVAEELAPALADPTGMATLPSPFDRLIEAFFREEGHAFARHAPGLMDRKLQQRSVVAEFVSRVGTL